MFVGRLKFKKNHFLILLAAALAIFSGAAGFWLLASDVKEPKPPALASSDPQLKKLYAEAMEGEKELAVAPKNYDGYMKAGLAWKSLGDLTGDKVFYERAIFVYENALKDLPFTNFVLPMNLANLYRYLGEYEKAEAAYRRAIEIAPGEPSLYVTLFEMYRDDMKKDNPALEAFFKEATSRLMDQWPLVPVYASYLKENGRIKEAADLYRQLAERFPNQPAYRAEYERLQTIVLNKLEQ